MVSRGGVEPFDGDLDDYQRYLLDEARRQREEAKMAAKAPPKPVEPVAKPKSKGDTSPKTRKELHDVEARMETLNGEGAALEGRLSTNPHPAEIAEIGRSLTAVNEELKVLEDRWLALTTLLGD
jgi:ATP-binding cassette subfamily F protein 3